METYDTLRLRDIKWDSRELVSEYRCDFVQSEVSKIEKTDEGYLKGEVPVAKVGVLKYALPNGGVRRELVPEGTLFNEDDMGSIKLKPVVNLHPKERRVDATTAKKYTIGSTGEMVRRDNNYLVTSIVITHKDGVESVKNGRQQLSPGYKCDLIMRKGKFKGEEFDAIQVKREYNHLAICDNARGGSDLKIRTDEADGIRYENSQKTKGDVVMPKITIRGVDYEAPQEVINHIDELDKEVKTAKESLDSKGKEIDKITAERDNLKTKTDEFEKRDINSEIQEAVKTKLSVIDSAKMILPKEKHDSLYDMSELEIKKETVQAQNSDLKIDDKSSDYVSASFDLIIDQVRKDKLDNQRRKSTPKNDGSKEKNSDDYRNDMVESMKSAWKNEQN
jgi:hypothetical protein